MTEYQREIKVKLFTMRDLAKNTNHKQAKETISKLAYSYNKSVIADILKQAGIAVPQNATKTILVNKLVHTIVTEAVIDKSWQRWFFKMMVVIGTW